MSNTRVKVHPVLGILVCTDGHVMVPANGKNKAHWTLGSKHSHGYRQVRINNKRYYVHRLIIEAFKGPIPKGCQIDHRNRIKHDNRLENIRIVDRFENMRNTYAHDHVTEQGRTHFYEDKKQAIREVQERYRAEHPDKVREQKARYNQDKRKTHRQVHFAGGLCRWVPHEEAESLLKIPLRDRRLDYVSNK